jgi:hypothetical protein
MSSIVRTPQIIQAFLDENQSLNDTQRQVVRQNFQFMRSNLAEYGLLFNEKNHSFFNSPARYVAVGTARKPMIPMMITLTPPDVYPSEESRRVPINSPSDVNIQIIKFTPKGGATNFEVRRRGENEPDFLDADTNSSLTDNGSLIAGAFTPPASQTTEVRVEEELDTANYLTSLTERYKTFQSQTRRASNDLEDSRQTIVMGRKEVRDTFFERSQELRSTRSEETEEDFLRNQVLAMRDLPPLFMYLNPNEFNISYEHVISDGNKGRQGYIIEHWGLQQPKINASGKIGATYIHARDGLGRAAGGLTTSLRRESASYQNFMNLFRVYKNNAYIYTSSPSSPRISVMGSVKLFYDDTIYTGSFDTFSISESDTEPHTLNYNFSFTVRFMDRISSEREDV